MANTAEPTGVLKVIQKKIFERMIEEVYKESYRKETLTEGGGIDCFAVLRRAQRLAKEKGVQNGN